MKIFLIIATCFAFGAADIGLNTRGGYSSSGIVLTPPGGSYIPPRTQQGSSVISADNSEDNYVPKVYTHAYVYSAPDDEVQQEKRVIRVKGGDKHVNVIFVKTPSPSSNQATEVILPQSEPQKNIVYVLLKKPSASDNVKITRPVEQLPQQSPARLYETPAVSAPVGSLQQPSGAYGTPSAEALSPPTRTQPVRAPSRVYDVPPQLAPIREPSGLYGTPTE